jgi:hypothetical protein
MVLAGMVAVGCASNEFTGEPLANESPDVWISGGPSAGSVRAHKAQFYWMGFDRDGDVLFYEFAITDDDESSFDPDTPIPDDRWHAVYRNDSTISFSADVLFDSGAVHPDTLRPVEFRKAHTFVIRAVDDRGARSVEPAYRSFVARNLSPVVDVVLPQGLGDVPIVLFTPIISFAWNGVDYVGSENEQQDPDQVRWILLNVTQHGDDWDAALAYIRDNPDAEEWLDWRPYQALDGSGTSWTSPPIDFGRYLFAVQVMDDAGAVSEGFDLHRNVLKFVLSQQAP